MLGLTSTVVKDMHTYNLRKQSEICLYRPRIVGEPVLKGLQTRPLFACLSTGEIFLVEMGGIQKQWMGYFFAPNGIISRVIIPKPIGTSQKPGIVSITFTLFGSASVGFGSYDCSNRLNLWDATGKFTSSLLVPISLDSGRTTQAVCDKNLLVLGSNNIKTNYPCVSIIKDLGSSTQSQSIPLDHKLYSQAITKGKYSYAFTSPLVNVLSSGKIAFNLSISPSIYLMTEDGSIIEADTTPPHFCSILDASNFEDLWLNYDTNGCISQDAEEWFKTWTHSYPVYEYADNRLVVPRVLYPTFYLDLYSYSDKEIKYLGYASSDKEFLFADSEGIYLLEGKNDTSIVVGMYQLISDSYQKDANPSWSMVYLSSEQLTGIRKIKPGSPKSDTCKSCDRKNRKPRGFSNSIEKIKLISPDSVEYSLIDSLVPEMNHILVFGSPQDGILYYAFEEAQKYIKDNAGFDLTVVLTHPYPDELRAVAKLCKIDWNYPTLTNLDIERLYTILKNPLCFLVVSKDGCITASTEFPTGCPTCGVLKQRQ